MSRIALVGAGYISAVHADALGARRLAAVIDPVPGAAERLAARHGARAFTSIEAALAVDAFDRAHVLVPPDLHGSVAGELLRAGKPTLLEKPLAASLGECRALMAVAGSTPVGVNQNFVHHPAFARLDANRRAGRYGTTRAVTCLYHVPLRQLAGRQFGHWMFRTPLNLLLEQLVHPLSQLVSLAGPVRGLRAIAGPAIEIAPGLPFVSSIDAVLDCDVPVHLRFSVGESFPCWQVSLAGSDGVGTADILNNRCVNQGRTRLMEPVDQAVSGLATAAGLAGGAIGGLARYALATAGLRPRSDAFFLSMKASIAAFHDALDAGRAPALDAAFGAALVETCEELAAVLPVPTPRPHAAARDAAPPDVAVLGGTGFIGTALTRQLVAAGRRVTVMARSPRNLPAIFDDPNVTVQRGDISDEASVAAAIAGAPVVVNLAHGGGGADFAAVRAAMLGGAETVAIACLAGGVRRLIHVGSIAGLYLGPQPAPITGATPPDPQAEQRADYARAKALCDLMLLDRHRLGGLPVTILRPGVVVGEGTSPFHGGVGLYNNEQHCIGWNDGRNPLPFVEDVAAAIIAAIGAPGIEGRCYNIVGDVRPSAAQYTADLARTLGRPLRYHPQSPTYLWLEDVAKWLVKRAAGRNVPMPSRRDFLSRGMAARFDCGDAMRDLGWQPNADPARFHADALAIHA